MSWLECTIVCCGVRILKYFIISASSISSVFEFELLPSSSLLWKSSWLNPKATGIRGVGWELKTGLIWYYYTEQHNGSLSPSHPLPPTNCHCGYSLYCWYNRDHRNCLSVFLCAYLFIFPSSSKKEKKYNKVEPQGRGVMSSSISALDEGDDCILHFYPARI